MAIHQWHGLALEGRREAKNSTKSPFIFWTRKKSIRKNRDVNRAFPWSIFCQFVNEIWLERDAITEKKEEEGKSGISLAPVASIGQFSSDHNERKQLKIGRKRDKEERWTMVEGRGSYL